MYSEDYDFAAVLRSARLRFHPYLVRPVAHVFIRTTVSGVLAVLSPILRLYLAVRGLHHFTHGLAFVRSALPGTEPAKWEGIQFSIVVVWHHLRLLPQRRSSRLH